MQGFNWNIDASTWSIARNKLQIIATIIIMMSTSLSVYYTSIIFDACQFEWDFIKNIKIICYRLYYVFKSGHLHNASRFVLYHVVRDPSVAALRVWRCCKVKNALIYSQFSELTASVTHSLNIAPNLTSLISTLLFNNVFLDNGVEKLACTSIARCATKAFIHFVSILCPIPPSRIYCS